jgi:hypothetical protein
MRKWDGIRHFCGRGSRGGVRGACCFATARWWCREGLVKVTRR